MLDSTDELFCELEDLLVATFIFELVRDEVVGMKNEVSRGLLSVGRLPRGCSMTTRSVRHCILVVMIVASIVYERGRRAHILLSAGMVQWLRGRYFLEN